MPQTCWYHWHFHLVDENQIFFFFIKHKERNSYRMEGAEITRQVKQTETCTELELVEWVGGGGGGGQGGGAGRGKRSPRPGPGHLGRRCRGWGCHGTTVKTKMKLNIITYKHLIFKQCLFLSHLLGKFWRKEKSLTVTPDLFHRPFCLLVA